MIRIALLSALLIVPARAQSILVKPYIQPGDGPTLTGSDVKVLTWVTDQKPAEFNVTYGWRAGGPVKAAVAVRTSLDFETTKTMEASEPKDKDEPSLTIDDLKEAVVETYAKLTEREQHYYRYRAVLSGLPFDTQVGYRVRMGDEVLREAAFKTRASSAKPIRFVAVGDMASNKPEQRAIAYQISLQKPDFLIALGDIVYPGGRALQYMGYFFNCYNDVKTADPKIGAPLMGTIPFYPVIGNHDADVQKLPAYTDAFSAFYWFSVPKNGPGLGKWSLPLGKDEKIANEFKAAAGAEYPAMSNYSFDYGPAHFLVLDANKYAANYIEGLIPWIERDLAASRQPWKFVCFHHPAFHTSKEHYTSQQMRLLQPTFEKGGVDVVFAGHVHNYQRSMPLKFTPNPAKPDSRGRVNGDMILDKTYDGAKDTTPEGIIHIVTGGGGAKLYSVNLEKTIEELKKANPDNYQPLTTKYVADKHSFSVIEVTPTTFELKQIAIDGTEVDRFRITK